MAREINEASFKEEVLKADVALIDFWAPWCGPCKMMGPVIDQMAEEFGDKILIGKVDVDQEKELAREFRIMSIPTLIFFKNGEPVETLHGAQPVEAMRSAIEKYV